MQESQADEDQAQVGCAIPVPITYNALLNQVVAGYCSFELLVYVSFTVD